MTTTMILILMMCALLFLMIWAAAYFYPSMGISIVRTTTEIHGSSKNEIRELRGCA